jgi:transcriptional repressor AefR-like protein
MNAEEQRPSSLSQRLLNTRRRVIDATFQLMRERDPAEGSRETPAAPRFDAFLALLQDRLPVWHRVLADLSSLVGKAEVNDVLIPVTRAAIEFYVEIYSVAMLAFASPAQVVRFRRAVRTNELGPQESLDALADYLAAEQRLGRVDGDVDPEAAARLLLGACFQYAVTEAVMGTDMVPPREETADRIVYGLRLHPRGERPTPHRDGVATAGRGSGHRSATRLPTRYPSPAAAPQAEAGRPAARTTSTPPVPPPAISPGGIAP